MLFAFASALSAQITTDWTADLPAMKVPSGVTLNAVDTLTGYTVINFSINLDATTYDNATKATAFNAIGEALEAAIDNTWLATWGLADEDGVGTIVIKNIQRSWDNYDGAAGTDMYLVAEDVFRCTGILKYVLD